MIPILPFTKYLFRITKTQKQFRCVVPVLITLAISAGTQSPSLGKAIGMGYVRKAYSEIDNTINIKVRDKLLLAKVVKVPFA